MSNAEEFLATFRQIEQIFKERTNSTTGRSFHEMTKEMRQKDKMVRDNFNKLEDYRELRNAFVHRATNFKEPLAEPHTQLVEEMKYFLDKLQNPPIAYDIAIKGEDIGTVLYDDLLEPVVKKMIINGWTILPVLDNDRRVIGILSEYSLVKAISSNSVKGRLLSETTTVKDVTDFLDKPDEEDRNATYIFKSKKTLVHELVPIFTQAWKDMLRINAVFITEDGLPGQKLLGLITPWDLLRLED